MSKLDIIFINLIEKIIIKAFCCSFVSKNQYSKWDTSKTILNEP